MNPEDLIQQLEQSNIELFQMDDDACIVDTCDAQGGNSGELIASAFSDNMQINSPEVPSHNIGFNPDIPGLS